MEKRKAVIFDMDGVIFDSERLYIECCTEGAETLGMENIEAVCRRCIGVTTDITERILFEAYRDQALVKRFRMASVSRFREKYEAGLLDMKPGVTDLLACLKRQGRKVAVASSTRTVIVEKELKDAGIRAYFDQIVGGDRVSRSKPCPDIFLKAAELLEKDPEQCVVIEDSYNGIRAAKAAGMTAIMVPDLLEPDEEMKKLADRIVPTLLDVLEMVSGE